MILHLTSCSAWSIIHNEGSFQIQHPTQLSDVHLDFMEVKNKSVNIEPRPCFSKSGFDEVTGDIYVARSNGPFSSHLTFQLTTSTLKTSVDNFDVILSWFSTNLNCQLSVPFAGFSCTDQLLSSGVPQDFISNYTFALSNLTHSHGFKYIPLYNFNIYIYI